MTDAALSPPSLAWRDTAQGRCAAPVGHWTAAALADRGVARQLLQALAPAGGGEAGALSWDLSGLQRLDHVGAQLLWRQWGMQWPAQLQVDALQRQMLERVARLTLPPGQPRTEPSSDGTRSAIDHLGVRVLKGLGHARDYVRMQGQLLLDFVQLLRAPRDAPWRDLSGHLYQMGATAMPITALVGFLIGVVLAYLMALQLRQFGAEAFIVNILGISLIRELGPLLAAILVAGRSGSAITAQIGVMRVTEELDAMRVMGIAHGFRLVMPRALGLAIAMPLISVWTTLASLAGGMLASDLALKVTPAFFMQALPAAVEASNLALATGKSVVFGILIALVGCHYGLGVKPNTESLGQGTTASVVTSITVVILVDALFAILFKDVGI
ncbi:MAG: ABC transporter permease [Curvibacter lanceolatus]|uniref:MlaE family ABC transporter permease n=1 Tax=Curvibacter lanceolatus TaxID=86182 RepID=UPI0003723658|nr:ABC transporter permease [Curvibacter lanceolatus]MBV5294128.1 ABC transporter permease [Curvibacter lanceolatus]